GYKTDAERDGKGGLVPTGPLSAEGKHDPKATWRKPHNYDVKDDHTAPQISWNDAQEFCRWLSAKEGRTYRLPTEAEWEFACRAGRGGVYSFGYDAFERADYVVYNQRAPMPVGSKKPNRFGLFDMEGNAWEWCSDWFAPHSAIAETNPQGLHHGT